MTEASGAGALDDRAVAELRGEMIASIDVLAGVDMVGDGRGVTERRVAAGEPVVEQGDASDAVYFVLDGIGVVSEEGSSEPVELSRLGPGQFFGEMGVVHERPRSASVRAGTDLHLLRVDADVFRTWHARHPHIQEILETLERVYRVPDGRSLSIYRGHHGDDAIVTTVQGEPGGSCVISTKVVERDVVMFVRRPAPDQLESVEWSSEDRSSVRVLHVVSEPDGGHRSGVRLHGVSALGGGPDLGVLYRAVVDGGPITGRELNVFRATGHLGGRRPRRDPGMLCSCLRVSADQVDALDHDGAGSFGSVGAALGVGLVCGGCEPAVTAHLERRRPRSAVIGGSDGHSSGRSASIVGREPDIELDADRIRRLRSTVELQVAAAASANSTPGERFLIATLAEAAPLVDDPDLRADLDVFFVQEANHIRWHSQLNRILQTDVYPTVTALERANRRPYSSMERYSRRTRLAVCAASEHAADVFFEGLFERYYSEGARIHADPEVDRVFRESGVSELFAWHGREELDHRHVAFDTMNAVGTPYRARLVGLALVLGSLLRHQTPALWAMRREAGPDWSTYRRALRRMTRGLVPRLLAFAKPGFHPTGREPEFMARLRAETDHIPAG